MRQVSQLTSLSSRLAIAVSLIFSAGHYAFAQISTPSVQDDIDRELLDSTLDPPGDDLPPPPEYPYPGAKEEGITPDDAPKTALAPTRPEAPVVQPNLQIERPKKIDDETGDYFYGTKIDKPVPAERDAEHMPSGVLENGEYNYATDLKPPPFSNRVGIEKPVEIRATGEFKYSTEESPTSGTASFRVGFFGPPMLKNPDSPSTTFQTVYTRDQLPVLMGDYEIPLTKKIGALGLRIGSGLFVASGQGQFAVNDANRRSDDIPQERYTFLMLPNTLTAQYRFQYKDTQTIVPYLEGGGGFFLFSEFRDDSSTPKVGGALTAVAAGGLNFLMDWLDPDAIRNLDLEYGINHVFLTLEARQVIGLNPNYDFTSTVYNAGFLLQF